MITAETAPSVRGAHPIIAKEIKFSASYRHKKTLVEWSTRVFNRSLTMARPASKAASRSPARKASLYKRLSHPTLFWVGLFLTTKIKSPWRKLFRGLVFEAWQWPTLTWDLPHYHRRWIVSRLSSGWDQVVPIRYGRQAKLWVRWSLYITSPQFCVSLTLASNSAILTWIILLSIHIV